MKLLREIVRDNKKGYWSGIYSCCSANEDVIRAVLTRARNTKTVALIESTSNQVNQFGGYTGMTPADFAEFVYKLAKEVGLARHNIFLGGDHLGPLPWTNLEEEEALAHAEKLVCDCIEAGYSKIHLDTSMRVASDNPTQPFPTRICAERGARLCLACEKAFLHYKETHPEAEEPVYVIGSEVPVPGGDINAGQMGVTSPEDALATIDAYKNAFAEAGISYAFDRVVALVVEMGIEFHEYTLDEYNRRNAADLVKAISSTNLCIEGHSSDYQTEDNLRRLCEDGVAILKVGPAFTFSLREAMFSLEQIERELYFNHPEKRSHYRDVLDAVMVENPSSWDLYYSGNEVQRRVSRAYSFYDRSRYYLNDERVKAARERLLANLSGNVIPLCLLSQYLPKQYVRVRRGQIRNEPLDIVLDRIGDRIDCYLNATNNCGRGFTRLY